MTNYEVGLDSFRDGIKRMLIECGITAEEAAEDIGLEKKSIYRWLTKSKNYRFPKREPLNKLLKRCGYQMITIQDGDEIYYLFTNKNKEKNSIQSDTHLLIPRLDQKRLEILRSFMILAPDITDQTIDMIYRYISDVSRIESSRPMMRVG